MENPIKKFFLYRKLPFPYNWCLMLYLNILDMIDVLYIWTDIMIVRMTLSNLYVGLTHVLTWCFISYSLIFAFSKYQRFTVKTKYECNYSLCYILNQQMDLTKHWAVLKEYKYQFIIEFLVIKRIQHNYSKELGTKHSYMSV